MDLKTPEPKADTQSNHNSEQPRLTSEMNIAKEDHTTHHKSHNTEQTPLESHVKTKEFDESPE